MTIASEITRIKSNIASAYTALSDKGATMPATQNSANLATTVASIPTSYNIPVCGLVKTHNSNKHVYYFKSIVGNTVVIAGFSDGSHIGTSVDVYKTYKGVATLLQTISSTDLAGGNTVTITISGDFDGLYLD